MIFRFASIIAIAASVVYVLSRLKPLKISLKDFWQLTIQDFRINLFIVWRTRTVSIFQRIKYTVAYICAILFLILFLTSFIPVVFGYHMGGLFMLIHVQTALLMSILIVLFVFLFSNGNQLSIEELNTLYSDIKLKRRLNSTIMLKSFYWLIIALLLPAIFSIILMLYPIFGTEGLELLADVHRWSVLLLTISLIFVQYFRIILINDDKTKGV